MTSTPSFTFFCYLLVVPLLVGFLFQDVSWCFQLLPTLFYGRPSPGYGCSCRAFLDSHSPCFLWSQFPPNEVWTLPGGCAHSPVEWHTTWTGWWPGGEEAGAVAAGEFPKVPPRVFFFLGKSSCSILQLPPYKEGPVLSHSPPLQLYQGLSGSGSHMAQLSTLPSQCPRSPWVYHFILIPLPATSSNQVSHGVAPALFGRGGSH